MLELVRLIKYLLVGLIPERLILSGDPILSAALSLGARIATLIALGLLLEPLECHILLSLEVIIRAYEVWVANRVGLLLRHGGDVGHSRDARDILNTQRALRDSLIVHVHVW
jgi:hypothetical protein